MTARAGWRLRLTAIILVFGVALAGCAGVDVLFQLGATVDEYFDSGDFAWDVLEAVHVVGKVLGSGGMA